MWARLRWRAIGYGAGKRRSNQHHVASADGDPEVGAVADQLAHFAADCGHQETVVQWLVARLAAPRDILQGLLLEPDDSSDVSFQSAHV